MFLVIIPVIVPFFTNLGLTMREIFELQAIFGISVMLLEIPTGYICDLWGRKTTLLIGSFISGIGFTYLNTVTGYWDLVIYEIIIAIALSFVSGADVSLLYDSVNKAERGHGVRSLANMQMFSVSGESIASLLGGFLVAYSFKHVTVANAITGWIPFLIALTIKEIPYEKMSRSNHLENFKEVFRHVFQKSDRILFLTSVNLVIWGLSTFFAVWMFQKYWDENKIPLVEFGIIWALYNVTVGIVGKQVHWLEERFGPTALLVFLGLAPIIGYFGMSFAHGYLGVALGFLFYFSRGMTQVLMKDALNSRTPSSYRATVNSMQSFFFRMGFALLGPAVGFLIDAKGMRFSMLILGIMFSVFFVGFLVPLIVAVRKLPSDAQN